MMKILALFLVCALVAVSEGQDMTSLMFHAMGLEPPPMPPKMPSSLRRHLYPQRQQQQQQAMLQLRLQALQAAQQQQNQSKNPYSTSYRASLSQSPTQMNSVYSPANMIRQPGVVNTAAMKGNPYSAPSGARPATPSNPYSVSRASGSSIPSVRQTAAASRVRLPPTIGMLQTMKKMREQPKKIHDAKMAGCTLPVDSTAASILMFNDCRSAAARMVCQAELMQCMDVGMAAMCCPLGMNRLAMDTITYMNKLQKFAEQIA